jgi:hypothetical protein
MAEGDLAGLIRGAVDEIWNRGLVNLADRLFATTYVNHGGLIPDLIQGPEAIKLSVILCHLAFPTLHVVVEDLVANGETVAFRWIAHGTRRAPEAEITAPELTGITFSRFAGDQIVESWTYWDVEGESSPPSLSSPHAQSMRSNRSHRAARRATGQPR